jgi:hypothetical protein
MDVMEDFHHMLFNTSDMQVVLRLNLLIHTQDVMEGVFSERILPLDMLVSEATILLKVTKTNLPKDCIMLVRSLSHLKSLTILWIIKVVFSVKSDVELLIRMLIMLYLPLDMVSTMVNLSGTLKTHGVLNGETKDISKLSVDRICVPLLNAIPTP